MKRVRRKKKIIREWEQFFIAQGVIYQLEKKEGGMVTGKNMCIKGIGSASKIKIHKMHCKMIPKKSLSKMYEILVNRKEYILSDSSSYTGELMRIALFELDLYLDFVEKLIIEKFWKNGRHR